MRLGLRPNFPDYFQVYNGIESANGLSMAGTFRVYRGFIPSASSPTYTYQQDPQVYTWTATLLNPGPYYPVTWTHAMRTWHLNGNGWPGSIRYFLDGMIGTDQQLLVRGQVYDNGMVGAFPNLDTVRCDSGCTVYFIRASSTDLSLLQVYVGSVWTLTSIPIRGSRTFVEIANGRSTGISYSWNTTYLGWVLRP